MTRKRKQAPSTDKRYYGLKNQGATCYLNSVLQVLYMTKDFREAVSQSSQHGCIDRHLSSVFNCLTNKDTTTQKITNHLGITKVNEQHDAAECFERILSCSSSEASEIFKGELTHKNTCSNCETETESNSPFWSLPLTLSEIECYCVTDGIQKYFQESKLCGENQLYCHECENKTDASIKLALHHHPEVLTLLLKRFKFDYNCMDYVKIKCTVKFPDILELPITEDKSQHYKLYAFVEHSGDLRSGHYIVKIKPQDNDKWYTFNDNMVTLSDFQPFQVDKEETSPSAYLLFYRKNPSDADSHGAPTSGCSKSYEPCRTDVEAAHEEKGEKEPARTEYNEGREKTHNRGEPKPAMVDKRSKTTGSDNDSLMLMSNVCTEHKTTGADIDNNINCKISRKLHRDGENKEKLKDGLKCSKQSQKTVQKKKKTRNNQATHGKGKRAVENQPKCEDLDSKQDSSGTPSENSSTDLCYEPRETMRKDVRENERIEEIKPVGHYSEAGGKHQISCSANGDENGLKQDVMLEEKHPNHNTDSEGQDSAVTDDLDLNQCNDSSAGTDKSLCIERSGDEAKIKTQQTKTNDEKKSKMYNDDRSDRNISTLSHEGPEGKKEKPKNDTCFQTREKSESLNRESEEKQKTVQEDKDCQNQFQGEIQQIINPVTQKGAVIIDPNSQTDTKANDEDTLSCCIPMQNQKDLLEQQIQRDEKNPTGSENCENVNEREEITESNTERITDMQLKSLNGSGKTNKCTEHKKPTEINIENNINCGNDCRLGIDGQSRDKLRDGSEKPNDLQKNRESDQNKTKYTKTGKDQVANDRRKSIENIDNQQKECEDLDIKQDVSDTLSENDPTGLCYENDLRDHEERKETRRPEGRCGETGEKDLFLCSTNVNENGLNKNVLHQQQHTNHNKQSEDQDSAGVDDFKLNQYMEKNSSSAENYNPLNMERFGDEETVKVLPEKIHNQHQQNEEYDAEESKTENSDKVKQNIFRSLHEEQRGTKENPQNDKCFQTREKSDRLIDEGEANKKTVQQDKDSQNQLQSDIQLKSNTGTLKRAVKIDPKCQNDSKANDGETSHCILLQNQKDLSEPQIQRDEKESTGIESKILAESIAVSPNTENHQGSGNGSGENKKQNKKRQNNKRHIVASIGLVYPPKKES